MPYTNAQATPRSDIFALMMQANSDFNKMFIGDKIFPVKTENVKRGIYMRANLADAQLLNADAKPRESGAAYQRVNREYDTDQYDAQEYGLEAVIDDSYEEEVERFMNLEATEAMLLERSLRISYELRVAQQFTSTNFSNLGNAAFAINPAATYVKANQTGTSGLCDPAGDVDTAKLALAKNGYIANAVIMSANLFYFVRRCQLLQNQVYGVVPRQAGQRALPAEEDVARAFGVDNLFVAKAPYNTNQQGQTYAGSFIWPDTYIIVCVVQGGEYQAGGIGRTIQWSKDTTGLFTPETYRSDERRSNILRVRQHTAEKIIDPLAAVGITTSYTGS